MSPDGFTGFQEFSCHLIEDCDTVCSGLTLIAPTIDAKKCFTIGEATNEFEIPEYSRNLPDCPFNHYTRVAPAHPSITETLSGRGVNWDPNEATLDGSTFTVTTTAVGQCGSDIITESISYEIGF